MGRRAVLRGALASAAGSGRSEGRCRAAGSGCQTLAGKIGTGRGGRRPERSRRGSGSAPSTAPRGARRGGDVSERKPPPTDRAAGDAARREPLPAPGGGDPASRSLPPSTGARRPRPPHAGTGASRCDPGERRDGTSARVFPAALLGQAPRSRSPAEEAPPGAG